MSFIGPKPTALRLDPTSYESLRHQILRRDGWRCQACGAMSNLEVHHKRYRSHSGHDSEENLITLCVSRHEEMHSQRRDGRMCVPIPRILFRGIRNLHRRFDDEP